MPVLALPLPGLVQYQKKTRRIWNEEKNTQRKNRGLDTYQQV